MKNGQGVPQQWPSGGPVPGNVISFAAGDQVTVAMSGTITAVLQWVDENNSPITDAPPPAEVYVMQTASASWIYGGEEVAANVTNEGVSVSLPGGTYQTVNGPPNWSRPVFARKLSMVDGSSGTVSLPVTLDAHVTLTCTSGFFGNAETQVNYQVVEIAPADCYDFEGYPNPPPSGTTDCAYQAAKKLAGPLADGTGYYTEGRAYTNQTAHHTLEQLRKTAIFYVLGHGGDKDVCCQTFYAPGLQPNSWSPWGAIVHTPADREHLATFGIPGASIPPMPRENVVVLSEQPSGAFRRVLLAVYEGCYTHSLARTNPVSGTLAKGAKCVVGFRAAIGEAQARSWAELFWRYVAEGATVSMAASRACTGWPLNDPIRQYSVLGAGTTVIHPARYGE